MYKNLAFSLVLSFCVMYAVMFLNFSTLDHYYTSLTRIYMSLLMVAPMVWIMMFTMRSMFTNKRWNTLIITASVLVFALTLHGLRVQEPIGDERYLKAMIPHHSSAILTSEEANLGDPEVKRLAEEIIQTQKEEIALMERILKERYD